MTSRAIETHLPCPDTVTCGSSDAYVIYDDGHGHCYSCGETFKEAEIEPDPKSIEKKFMSLRGISQKTMETYGVQTKLVDGVPDSVAFPFGTEALKVRKLERKNGKIDAQCIGEFRNAPMFGQDRFDRGSKESITITEGEFDALAAFEMLRFKSACISIKSGATGAYSDLVKHYDYVNSFDKIYLCFDADEPGQGAVKSLAGLFDFTKVYHVKLGKYKDANEYLQNGAADEFESTWKAAKRFAPDNIISSFSDIEKALDVSAEDLLATYPFAGLNDRLYGIHAGEVIVIKAPEGVGKTEFFRALEHHILKTTDYPIGIIHLEEDNATTIKAIAGYELEVPAVLPDCGLSKQDILNGYKSAVQDDEGRVHIHSSFDVEDENSFFGGIRFLVSVLGCRIVTLDHITWMGTGMPDDDERKKLDRISQKFKLLAKELRFACLQISHVNDDGKTRGSRNITKVANTVISLHRDLLEDGTGVEIIVEKARLSGRTGRAGTAWFHRDKGKLLPEPPKGFLPKEEDE